MQSGHIFGRTKLQLSFFSLLLLVSLAFTSCRNDRNIAPVKRSVTAEKMEEVNRILNQKDAERILAYGERKGLDLVKNDAGLWYDIKRQGAGKSITDGDIIIMEYECLSLDGTPFYSSESAGPRIITVGQSEIENGLDMGIRMLADGGEATFILPPFLAYGLAGDDNKIPPRSVIVYNIKVKIKE